MTHPTPFNRRQLFAQAAGAPLDYAGASVPRPRLEAVIVPKDSAIRTVADLTGKKVAYNKGASGIVNNRDYCFTSHDFATRGLAQQPEEAAVDTAGLGPPAPGLRWAI